MRKIGFLFILGLVSVSASAITVETPGKGTFTECKDSFGGCLSSCDEEKVQIPQFISEGSVIQAIFLGKNRGKYINFEVDEIKYNSSKGSCRLIYPNGSSNMTIGIGKCKNLLR